LNRDIIGLGKTQVLFEGKHGHGRKLFLERRNASVGGTIVDHKNLNVHALRPQDIFHAFQKQIPRIPIDDDDGYG
jgi:hypothetical protein